MKSKQSGFTLIEIAIVLVIIGLLLGGVLKGQELINSAKVKNLATDFKNVPVYIYGYQDKFRALPGDDQNAQTHVGSASITVTPCSSKTGCNQGNGMLDGNWNDGSLNGSPNVSEAYLFWQHVRLAGLAPGSTDTTSQLYIPTNAVGGNIGIQSGTSDPKASPMLDAKGNAIRGSYIICSSGILGKFVKQLDLQMDDGDPQNGSMMAAPTNGYAIDGAGNKSQSTTDAAWSDAATYNVCMGI